MTLLPSRRTPNYIITLFLVLFSSISTTKSQNEALTQLSNVTVVSQVHFHHFDQNGARYQNEEPSESSSQTHRYLNPIVNSDAILTSSVSSMVTLKWSCSTSPETPDSNPNMCSQAEASMKAAVKNIADVLELNRSITLVFIFCFLAATCLKYRFFFTPKNTSNDVQFL
jgi:hypothetical protein